MSSGIYGKCPATVDLCLPQGQTWDVVLIYSIDNEPVNLEGFIARMMLRTTTEAASPTVALSTTDGTMSVTTAGRIILNYPAASSSAITAATYLYDMELQSPSGNVRRLIQGRTVVSREITR